MKDFTQLVDVFFNGRTADKANYRVNGYPGGGGIDRRCPKCGVPLAAMEWDSVFKEVKLACVGGCGFRWSAQPLDSQAQRQGRRTL